MTRADSGQIGMPMLTLHTLLDPEVPIATEALHRQKVLAAGRGKFLVQRTLIATDLPAQLPARDARSLIEDVVHWTLDVYYDA